MWRNVIRKWAAGLLQLPQWLAAKLGRRWTLLGVWGDDDTGNSLLAELESLGVNTRYTRRYAGAKSSQSAVIVDAKGERIIVNYPSPDLLHDADWLNEIDFSQWDVVAGGCSLA
ncbi:sugar kinase [Citrobacter koseri]|nr:sugar kinase [Citrobacter koseri]